MKSGRGSNAHGAQPWIQAMQHGRRDENETHCLDENLWEVVVKMQKCLEHRG